MNNFASMHLLSIHHIAIICSDYERSKQFYTKILGARVLAEHYREERQSWKCDLAIGTHSQIELFTFPDAPPRPSRPESCGLRHIAFAVEDIEIARKELLQKKIDVEEIRIDPYTQKRFFFFADPDNLPIELYEMERE
jgi:glyoxylase I family protein